MDDDIQISEKKLEDFIYQHLKCKKDFVWRVKTEARMVEWS